MPRAIRRENSQTRITQLSPVVASPMRRAGDRAKNISGFENLWTDFVAQKSNQVCLEAQLTLAAFAKENSITTDILTNLKPEQESQIILSSMNLNQANQLLAQIDLGKNQNGFYAKLNLNGFAKRELSEAAFKIIADLKAEGIKWRGLADTDLISDTMRDKEALDRKMLLGLPKEELVEEIRAWRRLANQDALTKLANRRVYDIRLEKEISRARRTGETLSLLILDIDHFKKVNDEKGHQVGDAVLAGVAKTIRGLVQMLIEEKVLRAEDEVCCRYGGEEFVVILPGCKYPRKVAARIQEAIREEKFSGLDITVSIGATKYKKGQSADDIFINADAALYFAKEAGRDRVVLAESL